MEEPEIKNNDYIWWGISAAAGALIWSFPGMIHQGGKESVFVSFDRDSLGYGRISDVTKDHLCRGQTPPGLKRMKPVSATLTGLRHQNIYWGGKFISAV